MVFPPPIRDVLVQENGFSKPVLTPACGIDGESHCSQDAQRQALGDNGVQRFEDFVRRSQFADAARVIDQPRLKVGKTLDRFGVDRWL